MTSSRESTWTRTISHSTKGSQSILWENRNDSMCAAHLGVVMTPIQRSTEPGAPRTPIVRHIRAASSKGAAAEGGSHHIQRRKTQRNLETRGRFAVRKTLPSHGNKGVRWCEASPHAKLTCAQKGTDLDASGKVAAPSETMECGPGVEANKHDPSTAPTGCRADGNSRG